MPIYHPHAAIYVKSTLFSNKEHTSVYIYIYFICLYVVALNIHAKRLARLLNNSAQIMVVKFLAL